jgi:hypothetical protein
MEESVEDLAAQVPGWQQEQEQMQDLHSPCTEMYTLPQRLLCASCSSGSSSG